MNGKTDVPSKELSGILLIDKPEGFTSFQIHEDYGKIFWIRDDLYRENYHNVIEPLIHYPGDRRFRRGDQSQRYFTGSNQGI